MYKCNNCGCKFIEPKKVDMETYYGVYSTFGNSYGNMISLCPECEDNDIEEFDEEEEWKDIPDYEGLYQASNFGRIKSLDRNTKCFVSNQYKSNIKTIRHFKGKILKPGIDKNGYKKINLNKNGKTRYFRVCRLVATTFIPNNDKTLQINHKDENKENDNADNLEWCTCKYNQNYGTRNERISKSRMRKVYQYDLQGNFIKGFESLNSAAKSVNGDYKNISAVCSGRQKTHKGYIWKYEKI